MLRRNKGICKLVIVSFQARKVASYIIAIISNARLIIPQPRARAGVSPASLVNFNHILIFNNSLIFFKIASEVTRRAKHHGLP